MFPSPYTPNLLVQFPELSLQTLHPFIQLPKLVHALLHLVDSYMIGGAELAEILPAKEMSQKGDEFYMLSWYLELLY